MSGPGGAFSSSYAQARQRFLESARAAGLAVESRLHPLKGLDGEDLAMDVARFGPAAAGKLLILSSACHGVEGYCGSGVQVSALRDAAWHQHAARNGVGVVYIHGLNPYGFSHTRRVTHENVDLNRNFQDFSKPLPVNDAYRRISSFLLPEQWPPTPANEAEVANYIAQNGDAGYQAAITRGQHEFPEGLFFGGTGPTWSNITLREVLRAQGRGVAHVAWIDIHTGLGPSGVGERIYAGRDEASAIARARAWWNGGGSTPVTSIYDGSSTSAFLTGLMWSSIHDECPQAQYTGMALEYGTVPLPETLLALRGEQWLHLHPEASPALAAQIKQRFKDAFFTDTPEWKQAILTQARESMFQAVDGLAR